MPEQSLASLAWVGRLIGFDTTSRHSNLELVEAVEAESIRLGLASTRIPNDDGTKANLLITIPAADGSTGGGVMLSGHTDVVPVDGQRWDSAPFEAEVRGDRLFGRGSTDMKAFLGVVLTWLPRFANSALSRPLHIALSYDEEVGCLGAVDLVSHLRGWENLPEVCVVGEPTGMQVVTGHKSVNLIDLIFHGKAAHSSLTPTGVNAIEYASSAITFIRGIAEELRLAGPFDDAYEVPHTTASVNRIDGGIAGNTVPERCTVQFEFRTIGADEPLHILTRIEDHVRGLERQMQAEDRQASVDIRRLAILPGLDGEADGPAARLAHSLGGQHRPGKVTYGTEAGRFHAAGIDTVVCGPGNITQAHTANEFVELTQLSACEQFIDNLVTQLSGPATHSESM